MPEGGTMRALFTRFVQMRQSGHSREEAWLDIEQAVNTLSPQERDLLLAGLRNWETTEGQAHKPTSDPYDTQNRPPERRNVIRRIQPLETQTPPPDSFACPSCHKMNPSGSLYCYSCGTILKVVPGASANGTQPLGPNSTDNAYFGENWVLYLKIQGTGETVRVQPRTTELILGRKSPDSVMIPDVDLAVYGAGDRGVSRLHASLRRQDDTLVLTDLDSVNHTFINGQRVHAHEVRALRDGDEVRLGRLVMYAYFRES